MILMADIKFEIIEKYGTISTSSRGWNKELNLVKWGEYSPKFDIREWSPDYDKMGKGITFTKDEAIALRNLLNSIKLD